MRNVLVLQHVGHEILGTLSPLLKAHKLRIKFVNFGRNPSERPGIARHNGLIVLGGPMGVYEYNEYPHLMHEMKLIEQAIKMNIPVLGICLGSQLIAEVLGAEVKKDPVGEIGWHQVSFTDLGKKDSVFSHVDPKEMLFQLHGDSFEVPRSCTHLAHSEICSGQAFRYEQKVYGIQFHLEVDEPMISRWMNVDIVKNMMNTSKSGVSKEMILNDTKSFIHRSVEISRRSFEKFIELFGLEDRPEVLDSGHGKPTRKLGD